MMDICRKRRDEEKNDILFVESGAKREVIYDICREGSKKRSLMHFRFRAEIWGIDFLLFF
jgi:hypothetical protein